MEILKHTTTNYYRRFLSLFFILVSINAANCQIDELRFTNISTNQGLSDNIVNCIAQDNRGFMWFGTSQGLNRYNGYSNQIFNKIRNDSTSIPDNKIYDIFIDHLNRIWIGTHNGLCYYNPEKENFTPIPFDENWYKYTIDNRVRRIKENSKKQLYVFTEAGYIFEYDRKKAKMVSIDHNFRNIKTAIIDNEDRFWMGGIYGLNFYDKKNGKSIYYDSFKFKNKKYDLTEINTILEEGDTIWLGTVKGRIFYILKSDMNIRPFENKSIDAYYIYHIFKSSNNLLYFSTTSGLYIYDKSQKELVSYTYNSSNLEGLSGIGITKVFEDAQKNLWIGTYQGGINFVVYGKSFTNYNQFSKEIQLDVANINAICEDSKGNLWLGSFDLGINVINPQTKQRKLYLNNPNDPNSLGYGTVHTIFRDSKNNIWVGTYLGYLQKYNPITDNFETYKFGKINPNPDFGKDIRSIAEDKAGNLWLICHGNGLIKFNPQTKEAKLFKRNPADPLHTLADNWSFYIMADHEGMIWIGSSYGLSMINPVSEKIKSYYNDPNDSTSLGNNYLNTIYEDSNNQIWIGTSFGLDLFDRTTQKFKHYYESDSLVNNQVNGIVEFKPGNLWISTSKGISNLKYEIKPENKIEVKFKNYTKADNLQDNYYWKSSVIKNSNNQIIFGGEKGIVVFNPDKIKDNTVPPNVYITGLKIFNKPVQIGDYDSILQKDILSTKEITLKYNQNYFTFEFVAINYIAQQKCKYKFMLEGFEEYWSTSDKQEATYTNLNPGKYTFKVIASNNDGYWNYNGTSIIVNILPPFWATWWFRTVLVLFIASIFLSLYWFKTNLLRKQNIILENRVLARTQELSNLNSELVKKNERILAQSSEIQLKNNEINTQKEFLQEQKNKVERAYDELTLYHNKLEDLVEERTKELIIAKDKAEEADKLKTSFLSNLSHEIRTPLNSIIGFSNIVFDEGLTIDEKREYRKLVEESCFSLLSLINDIIDYSKIEAGDIVLYINEVSVEEIIESLKEIFHFEHTKQCFYKTKNLDFKLNVPQYILKMVIKTDIQRLKQILNNLISNAIKFTPEGFVEFGCKFLNNNQFIEFYVKDTGIGIRKEDHEIIFHRFRKIESNSMDLFRGTGIGLSIAQQLVKILGGVIKVESEINKGTTFYVSFPTKIMIPSGKFLNSNNKTDLVPDLSGKTILIAEDDMGNFMYMDKVFKKTNAHIFHATNGRESIEIIRQHPDIQLILMDIKMPIMNGMEALPEIRKLNASVPIIAQTAYAFSDEILKIKEAGFTDYISKPIIPKDLYSLVSKYI